MTFTHPRLFAVAIGAVLALCSTAEAAPPEPRDALAKVVEIEKALLASSQVASASVNDPSSVDLPLTIHASALVELIAGDASREAGRNALAAGGDPVPRFIRIGKLKAEVSELVRTVFTRNLVQLHREAVGIKLSDIRIGRIDRDDAWTQFVCTLAVVPEPCHAITVEVPFRRAGSNQETFLQYTMVQEWTGIYRVFDASVDTIGIVRSTAKDVEGRPLEELVLELRHMVNRPERRSDVPASEREAESLDFTARYMLEYQREFLPDETRESVTTITSRIGYLPGKTGLIGSRAALGKYRFEMASAIAAATGQQYRRGAAFGFAVQLEAALRQPAQDVRAVAFPRIGASSTEGVVGHEGLSIVGVVPPAGFEAVDIPVCVSLHDKVALTGYVSAQGKFGAIDWRNQEPRPLDSSGNRTPACHAFIREYDHAFREEIAKRIPAKSANGPNEIAAAIPPIAPTSSVPPDWCEAYARRAVEQYALTQKSAACAVAIDARWQPSFDNHLKGCRSFPRQLMESEDAVRAAHLASCAKH
jgi:hypothetical protein